MAFSLSIVIPSQARPIPVCHKVLEYFEAFIIDNVLIPMNIIVNAKTDIRVAFMPVEPSDMLGNDVTILTTKTVSGQPPTRYTIVQISTVFLQSDQPLDKLLQLFFEGLKKFFSAKYKKIPSDFFDKIYDKVNWDYLLALPYPAEKSEMKYTG